MATDNHRRRLFRNLDTLAAAPPVIPSATSETPTPPANLVATAIPEIPAEAQETSSETVTPAPVVRDYSERAMEIVAQYVTARIAIACNLPTWSQNEAAIMHGIIAEELAAIGTKEALPGHENVPIPPLFIAMIARQRAEDLGIPFDPHDDCAHCDACGDAIQPFDAAKVAKVRAQIKTAFRLHKKKGMFCKMSFGCCYDCGIAQMQERMECNRPFNYVFSHEEGDQMLDDIGCIELFYGGAVESRQEGIAIGRSVIHHLLDAGADASWSNGEGSCILVKAEGWGEPR